MSTFYIITMNECKWKVQNANYILTSTFQNVGNC